VTEEYPAKIDTPGGNAQPVEGGFGKGVGSGVSGGGEAPCPISTKTGMLAKRISKGKKVEKFSFQINVSTEGDDSPKVLGRTSEMEDHLGGKRGCLRGKERMSEFLVKLACPKSRIKRGRFCVGLN